VNRLYLLPFAASAIVLFAVPAAAAAPEPTAVVSPTATDGASATVEAAAATAEPSATPAPEVIGGNFGADMQLELVVIQPFDLDDDDEEFVLFCFRDDVQEIVDPGGFYVSGFESTIFETAQTLRIFKPDDQCVLAGFPAGTDLQQFSVAGVSAGVVHNVQDDINLPTTVGLEGAQPSLNTRPQLLEVTDLNTTLNRATFVFSDNLDEEFVQAERFGYDTLSGVTHLADRTVSIEDGFVIVEWDEEDGDEVEDAVRFYVADGAVADRQGFANVTSAFGDTTSAPDLEDVENISRGLWSFSFDEAVVPLNPGDFILYTQDGDRFAGDDFASVSTDEVSVVFRVVENFADQVTFAAVSPGAVRSISADGATNTYGSEPLPGSVIFYIGVTAGPDLLTVAPETSPGIVAFTFDGALDQDAGALRERFYLMTNAGEIVPSRAIIEVQEDRIVALFDETLAEAAVAAGVIAGAVFDENGNPNLDRALIRFGTSLTVAPMLEDSVDPPTTESPDEPTDEVEGSE